MTLLEKLPESPGAADSWLEQGGVDWFQGPLSGIREVARAMNAVQARFITITAYELPKNEGTRLEYHWDLDGRLLGFAFNLAGKSFESIYDICEAVDWIEREVHEGFGVNFTGREYEPLLLRQGDTPGVNTREGVAQ